MGTLVFKDILIIDVVCIYAKGAIWPSAIDHFTTIYQFDKWRHLVINFHSMYAVFSVLLHRNRLSLPDHAMFVYHVNSKMFILKFIILLFDGFCHIDDIFGTKPCLSFLA